MSRVTSRTNSHCEPPARKSKTPCCPDCGALECLCRPRFFTGQLLSEQDLNRLDQYIKNKNRLHNRSQHGWGVVNGLLVLCDPCGEVTVTEGYAVDPCGDDIVVCQDNPVNICELIEACRQESRLPNCDPFIRPPNSNCDDLEEEWVLTIKYEEWPSRGVTALRGNTCRTSACCCGAGSAKECSCGGYGRKTSALKNTQNNLKKRGAPPECEATVTCEGFSFDVYKKPDKTGDEDEDRLIKLEGAFWDAFNCCAEPLVATIPVMPDLTGETDLMVIGNAISKWCCQFRANLLKYFSTHRNTSCEIIDFLRAVNCPNVMSSGTFLNDMIVSFLQLLAAWLEGVKICFCLSLLPPPPQATCDTRVPLASVRIRARDCKILSICNWTTERQMMITWPTVTYWLGIFQVEDMIREVLDTLCCRSLLTVFDEIIGQYMKSDKLADATPSETIAMDEQPQKVSFGQSINLASGAISAKFDLGLTPKMKNFSILVDTMAARGEQPLDLGAVLNAVSPRFKLPDNGKPLSNLEAKNLPLVLMSEVMVKPVLSTLLGEKKAVERVDEYVRGLGKTAAPSAGPSAGDGSMDELKKQLNEMRSKMNAQDKQIKALAKKIKK